MEYRKVVTMKTYIAFLRGINVGGKTALPMARLKSICQEIGFENVQTYIRSGNVLFESELTEEKLAGKLEHALLKSEEKHIPVIIRTENELKNILNQNPFPTANPAQVGVMFFSNTVPQDLLNDLTISGPEEVEISLKEIYVHYPNGIGRSKLKLPKKGTMRNINTITKLVEMGKNID